MSQHQVRLLAPAKLTLSLKITGIRAAGFHRGYHEIDATMVTLDLCDELILSPGEGMTVVDAAVVGSTVVDAAAPQQSSLQIPTGDDNLIQAALRLVAPLLNWDDLPPTTPSHTVVHVELHKHIPVGGGLGGGSADAAAILRWANSLLDSAASDPNAPVTADKITADKSTAAEAGKITAGKITAAEAGKITAGKITAAQACQLGADVGFCLTGGRARVRGIGEQIEQLPFVPEQFTLLTPPFGVSSGQVYKAWDRLASPMPANPMPTNPVSTNPVSATSNPAVNDLEQAAIAVAPELSQWRDALAAQTGQEPTLAGSGSTWFVKGHFPEVSYQGIAAIPVTATDTTAAS